MNARPKSQVHVTIDRLVLRGFAAGERDALVRALEGALRNELEQRAHGAPLPTSRSLASLTLPTLRVEGGIHAMPRRALPRRIGVDAGRALAKGVRS
jgi:hypothetical protein